MTSWIDKKDVDSCWRNRCCVDSSDFAKQAYLASLKLNVDELERVASDLISLKYRVDKIDIGKSKSTPVDLNKKSDVVKNVVKKKWIWWIT